MDVAVRRLRVLGPPERSALAAFRIEDACRTALPETDRLVLVRTLRLPAAAADGHPARRRDAVAGAWRAATDRARHGGADRAEESDCVWFASREEARRLLLALLLAGRRPHGWFWRLAIPEWDGGGLDSFVRTAVRAALAPGGGAALPRLALQLAEAGRADLLVDALSAAVAAEAPIRPTPGIGPRPEAAGVRISREEGDRPREPAAPALLATLRARIPLPLREAVEELARQLGPLSAAAAVLLQRLLLHASPDLALAPARLATLVALYGRAAMDPAAVRPVEPPPPAEPRPERREAPADPVARVPAVPERPPSEAPAARPPAEILTAPHPSADPPPGPRADPGPAPFSAAAGLWLVVPALIRLGWREWLLARPDLIGTDPGRTLIGAIGRHHRVPPDDPALAPLALDECPPPPWVDAWRRALRRTLRRDARLGLARLVWKPGRILRDEERLVVRFPLAAIDLRLRRRALDVDPGWVDWLGLSLRYVFADEAAR